MPSSTIHSDQLYNWSANERFPCRIAPSASNPGHATGPAPTSDSSRLVDRALQALRPSWLQVSNGAGTRAQVLLICQPGGQPTRDGLRPRRIFPTGLRLPAELPESTADAGADLQYQPRVVTAPNQVLTRNAHGAFLLLPARSRFGWEPRRQFFAELVASQFCLTGRNSKPRDLP